MVVSLVALPHLGTPSAVSTGVCPAHIVKRTFSIQAQSRLLEHSHERLCACALSVSVFIAHTRASHSHTYPCSIICINQHNITSHQSASISTSTLTPADPIASKLYPSLALPTTSMLRHLAKGEKRTAGPVLVCAGIEGGVSVSDRCFLRCLS